LRAGGGDTAKVRVNNRKVIIFSSHAKRINNSDEQIKTRIFADTGRRTGIVVLLFDLVPRRKAASGRPQPLTRAVCECQGEWRIGFDCNGSLHYSISGTSNGKRGYQIQMRCGPWTILANDYYCYLQSGRQKYYIVLLLRDAWDFQGTNRKEGGFSSFTCRNRSLQPLN
jgi:hypothetical protein